ncbi:metallo-beta-lactamase family protein [Aureobasidium pullulans]|nr:metallo-beta-lactamase family protein [Aureobasidium pullulans]
MIEGEDLLLCPTCGTQFDVLADNPPSGYCRICDDPRQYIPATGQAWTSLKAEAGKHETKWKQDEKDKRVWSIWAEPKLGIGQRALLIQTPHGNILWDCIAYLDKPLVDFITSLGGLSSIIISHPHFYTTHLSWSAVFSCPIYTHALDEKWLSRSPTADTKRVLLRDKYTEIVKGVTAIQVGGHFEGSMVLHWDGAGEEGGEEQGGHLFIADTFVNVPSGFYRKDRPPGTTSFSFMWSIPNMIPLPPDTIHEMWKAIKPYDFTATHGLFPGWDIRDENVKKSVLDSMKIQVRNQGFASHALLDEE